MGWAAAGLRHFPLFPSYLWPWLQGNTFLVPEGENYKQCISLQTLMT